MDEKAQNVTSILQPLAQGEREPFCTRRPTVSLCLLVLLLHFFWHPPLVAVVKKAKVNVYFYLIENKQSIIYFMSRSNRIELHHHDYLLPIVFRL